MFRQDEFDSVPHNVLNIVSSFSMKLCLMISYYHTHFIYLFYAIVLHQELLWFFSVPGSTTQDLMGFAFILDSWLVFAQLFNSKLPYQISCLVWVAMHTQIVQYVLFCLSLLPPSWFNVYFLFLCLVCFGT